MGNGEKGEGEEQVDGGEEGGEGGQQRSYERGGKRSWGGAGGEIERRKEIGRRWRGERG